MFLNFQGWFPEVLALLFSCCNRVELSSCSFKLRPLSQHSDSLPYSPASFDWMFFVHILHSQFRSQLQSSYTLLLIHCRMESNQLSYSAPSCSCLQFSLQAPAPASSLLSPALWFICCSPPTQFFGTELWHCMGKIRYVPDYTFTINPCFRIQFFCQNADWSGRDDEGAFPHLSTSCLLPIEPLPILLSSLPWLIVPWSVHWKNSGCHFPSLAWLRLSQFVCSSSA